jgi:hypothetical protein
MSNEDLFEPIAAELEQFANRFGLHLEKFYKGTAGWNFGFKHPAGGVCSIQVMVQPSAEVLVIGHWHFDDEGTGTRHMRSTEVERLVRTGYVVSREVEELLRTMLNWKFGEWTRSVGGFKPLWSRSKGQDDYISVLRVPKI